MSDLFEKCSEYQIANQVREAGLYPYYRTITSAQEPVVQLNGRPVVMLGSNNYLGLTGDPEVKAAAILAVEKYGAGCAGSRLLNGTLDLHEELETKLADFMGRESVLTFSTGFQVNLGVLSCLLDRHDRVYLDALDHACIIDGARLGFGKMVRYKHNDMEDLEKKLAKAPEGHGKLIAVDGIFSMEGDLADLPGIVKLCKKYGVRLLVDEAHGVGVLGEHGRGTAEHFGLEDDVDLVMGTFSKSLATVGGFIAGDKVVVDYIRHHARTAIFSAAAAPSTVGAALKAVEILEREPERRKKLWENVDYMKKKLPELGFNTGETASPVIPIIVGDGGLAFRMAMRLQEEGVFVNPVIAPAVPPDHAMIRTSYMATHTREHLDQALSALVKVGKEMGVIP